jgi:hypothetical protein
MMTMTMMTGRRKRMMMTIMTRRRKRTMTTWMSTRRKRRKKWGRRKLSRSSNQISFS